MNALTSHNDFEAGGIKIAELARDMGTTPRALRHYEGLGLIAPQRTSGGARLYGPRMRRRVEAIVGLRRLGLSIDDIAETLGGFLDEARNDKILLAKLTRHLEELDQRRAETQAAIDQILHLGC